MRTALIIGCVLLVGGAVALLFGERIVAAVGGAVAAAKPSTGLPTPTLAGGQPIDPPATIAPLRMLSAPAGTTTSAPVPYRAVRA